MLDVTHGTQQRPRHAAFMAAQAAIAIMVCFALGCEQNNAQKTQIEPAEAPPAAPTSSEKTDDYPAGMHCDMRRDMGICFEYAQNHPLTPRALTKDKSGEQIRGILCLNGAFAPGPCSKKARVSVCTITDQKRHHLYAPHFDAIQAASYCELDSSVASNQKN